MAEFLTLGRVLKPHGVRGELKCACYSEDLEDFLDLERLWLARGDSAPVAFSVRKARLQASMEGVVLLQLEGLADRNQAEAWREADILVAPGDLPDPEDDEIYIEDLLGAAVFLEDGTHLGTFDHLFEPAADYDVWSIRRPSGGEILFPAREEFLMEVDVEAMRIVIDPPPGLIELYLEPQRRPGISPARRKQR